MMGGGDIVAALLSFHAKEELPMAGNFVPRLPTWNTTIINYIFDPISGTRSLGSGLSAQMYPPFRTSDNAGPSDAYIVFPKAVTEIHDPKIYNDAGTDAVVFNWQGVDWPYKVIQLLPRWLNFPNEHYLALLQRMTAAEFANILTPDPPGRPDFNVTATIYHVFDGAAGAFPKGTSVGQIYYQQLTHHADTYTSVYFLMPSANHALVDDDGQYTGPPQGYDIVEAEWPTGSGRLRQWRVGTCEPRLLGMPGEHIAICMEPLNITERNFWFPSSIPDAGTSTISAAPVFVADDGASTTTISGTMLNSAGSPIVGATVVTSSSGSAAILSSPVTDGSGNWSTTATNITAESVTFSATCLGVLVGPSNSVTFGGLAPSFDIDTAMTTGNGTCANCADLNGGFNAAFSSTDFYTSASFAAACISATGTAVWSINFAVVAGHRRVDLNLFEDGGSRICYWYNDNIDSWDGTSPISLPNFNDDTSGRCTWNVPATITPVP